MTKRCWLQELCLLGPAGLPAAPLAGAATAGAAIERTAVAAKALVQAVLLGAASSGTRIVAACERGIIALADDGGTAWRQTNVPTSVTLTTVRFAGANLGRSIGHSGVVLASSDGGERWTRRLDGQRVARLALESARAGGDAGAIKDAKRLVADGADKPLFDLLLLGGHRMLVVGAYGSALASDDGGQRWQAWIPRLLNPKGLHLSAARQRGKALLTFRSWRAVDVAIVPLMLRSVLAEALMVALGMGVKVATLHTDKFVMLAGLTLAIGVIAWLGSPIKFQADMGLLLAFMFLRNMLGALVLLPALAHSLLKPRPELPALKAAAFA